MKKKIRVTIWNEFLHERSDQDARIVYPKGIHVALADGLSSRRDTEIRTATLNEPDHGLTPEVIADTDVLIWWGHRAHKEVEDRIVERVKARVLNGMGLIVLHSGHSSKIFKSLLGTKCSLRWREKGEKARIWNINPTHPIAQDVGDYFELPRTEMYGERFDIPNPDDLIFISWFAGGEVFRSGCTFHRGQGRIFYFQPGHETYPIFYDKNVLKVISNAVSWANPKLMSDYRSLNVEPLERL